MVEAEDRVTAACRPKAGGLYDFDICGFTLIPEPATWALLALGGGVRGLVAAVAVLVRARLTE